MRHFYYITDESDNVVFRNYNFACFQEILAAIRFTKPAFNDDCQSLSIKEFLTKFLPGKRIHILIDPKISREGAEQYCKNLNTIFGNYTIEDFPFSSNPSEIWRADKDLAYVKCH